MSAKRRLSSQRVSHRVAPSMSSAVSVETPTAGAASTRMRSPSQKRLSAPRSLTSPVPDSLAVAEEVHAIALVSIAQDRAAPAVEQRRVRVAAVVGAVAAGIQPPPGKVEKLDRRPVRLAVRVTARQEQPAFMVSMETTWSISRVKTASLRAIPGSSARTSASSAHAPFRIALPPPLLDRRRKPAGG